MPARLGRGRAQDYSTCFSARTSSGSSVRPQPDRSSDVRPSRRPSRMPANSSGTRAELPLAALRVGRVRWLDAGQRDSSTWHLQVSPHCCKRRECAPRRSRLYHHARSQCPAGLIQVYATVWRLLHRSLGCPCVVLVSLRKGAGEPLEGCLVVELEDGG
jgi:hypothetical protein